MPQDHGALAAPTSSSSATAAAGSSPPNHAKRRGGQAFFVAAGILLSRIAGLVRERVFAHYFGNSDAAGAFKAALKIPNVLQNLFGEGVLSASFIPVYARLLAEGRADEAGGQAGGGGPFCSRAGPPPGGPGRRCPSHPLVAGGPRVS